jgi:cell division septation protein DedD
MTPEPVARVTSSIPTQTEISIPGQFQSVDYDQGGEGIAYHDTTPSNDGGAYRAEGVDIEQSTGESGPTVAYIRPGEWLRYTITVPKTCTYTTTFRVASPNNDRSFALEMDGKAIGTVRIPNTGSFETYTSVTTTIPMNAGVHQFKLTFTDGHHNLGAISVTPAEEVPPVTTQQPTEPSPTTTLPPQIPQIQQISTVPGDIEAENYDQGGEGIAYHDTTLVNQGGAFRSDATDIEYSTSEQSPVIAYTRTGEWLSYQIAPVQPGAYTLSARLSNPDSATKQVLVSIDGTDAATLLLPGTGSFDTYTTISTQVQLSSGSHQLRITFSGDRQNLDRLIFTMNTPNEPTSTVNTPEPVVQPAQAATESSFTATPMTGKRSLLVSFRDTSKGSPVGWYWQVNGGSASPTTSTQQNPSIWLNEARPYTVTLTTTYANGSKLTTTRTNLITVTN